MFHCTGGKQMMLRQLTQADGEHALEWRVIMHGQIWQAAAGPYLCTVVCAPDDASYYATIVRSGDLAILVLEDAATLEDAQAWCVWRVGMGVGIR